MQKHLLFPINHPTRQGLNMKAVWEFHVLTGYANAMLYLAALVLCGMTVTSLFVYTVELYPTAIRNTGLGFTSAMGRLVTVAAPFMIQQVGDLHMVTSLLETLPTLLVLGESSTRPAFFFNKGTYEWLHPTEKYYVITYPCLNLRCTVSVD